MATSSASACVTPATLQLARFIHMLSGLDDDPAAVRREAAVATTITGYTEWIGGPGHSWSLGWDWALDAGTGVVLRRTSFPATNLTLVQRSGDALAPARADSILAHVVDMLPWQAPVLAHLGQRYRP